MKDRFLKKVCVTESGCWNWIASKLPSGYGKFGVSRRAWKLAHRVSYELFIGNIPDGYFVCHKCDNPSCVNPDHLFLGTPKDNTQDMMRKHRCLKANAKIDAQSASEIREMRGKQVQREIGEKFGISQTAVSLIQRRVTWKDVPESVA